MLSSLLRSRPKHPSPGPEQQEDIFESALGLVFADDLQNVHGDTGTIVTYRSGGHGDLEFECADPDGEEVRTKFAHYVWNAGVLMAELVGGRGPSSGEREMKSEVWGQRTFADGREWWLTPEEETQWSVKGERVLELGAGV